MTREFMKSGQSVPVTVIKIEKGRVLDVITKDKRGYNAVKVGFCKIKNSKLTKQMKSYFTKKKTEPKKILKEFRIENNDQFKEGNEFGLEIFKDKKYNIIVYNLYILVHYYMTIIHDYLSLTKKALYLYGL